MAFLGLCKGDPVLDALRSMFQVNILKVPGGHIRPVGVIAFHSSQGARLLGDLGPLLIKENPPFNVPENLYEDVPLASVRGQRTQQVDLGLGLNILSGLLSGFGIPPAAVQGAFSGATKFAFSFQNVTRYSLPITALGGLLAGRKLDPQNPVLGCFHGKDPYDMLVIDSVVRSPDLSVHVTTAKAIKFQADLQVVADQFGSVGLTSNVRGTSALDVTFQGKAPLTFGFSCVHVYPEPTGEIQLIRPDWRQVSIANRGMIEVYSPDRALLSEEPGLLDLPPKE